MPINQMIIPPQLTPIEKIVFQNVIRSQQKVDKAQENLKKIRKKAVEQMVTKLYSKQGVISVYCSTHFFSLPTIVPDINMLGLEGVLQEKTFTGLTLIESIFSKSLDDCIVNKRSSFDLFLVEIPKDHLWMKFPEDQISRIIYQETDNLLHDGFMFKLTWRRYDTLCIEANYQFKENNRWLK